VERPIVDDYARPKTTLFDDLFKFPVGSHIGGVRHETNHTTRLKSGAIQRYLDATSMARRDFRPTSCG
jgi:hypothetical protein